MMMLVGRLFLSEVLKMELIKQYLYQGTLALDITGYDAYADGDGEDSHSDFVSI
jgi:hypothetical protein